MPFSFTAEEKFILDCARMWRSPNAIRVPADLDWPRVAMVGVKNRMATLLKRVLPAIGCWDELPAAAQNEIAASADIYAANAEMMSASLADYLQRADAAGVQTVVLKGLSISSHIYGDPAMRPGGDIDVLVRPEQVGACIEILADMGIGAFWPNLMADPYYERHHLHHQRSTPDTRLWYEIHWALDHPYTLFTIDYQALMDRTRPGELLGAPVAEMAPQDLLQSLAVHLVKHAIYLPDAVNRPDLARAVLADGMLMYYLDITETIGVLGDTVDWGALVALAKESGTVEVLGSVLRTCVKLLDAAVPTQVLEDLPVRGGGLIVRTAMNAVVDREIAQFLGEPPSRFWDLMLITNGAFILRPIRLIETSPYFFPGREFLQRKYGRSGPLTAAGHFLRAVGQFTAFGFDSVWFAIERYRRLKRIGYSTSLFNRLGTGG